MFGWLGNFFGCTELVGQERSESLRTDSDIEALAATAQKSVVKLTTEDRDGQASGIGSGFAIADGLIATNLHVIGEARPIWVHLPDGTRQPVTEVHASDATLDLAIVRIAASKLPTLPLADDATIARTGQRVIAIGHPLGFENSVVTGIVSGRRDINGIDMWQLAIPIEPGNSGGPLLDSSGRVQGVITLKSTISDSLGFAVTVQQLRRLLDRPNPVPMARWKTIGRVDPKRWETLFGARWQQRGGRILVDNAGEGFGGRSLLLWSDNLPELPLEISVQVKLDDEAGAAGLVFLGDGQHRHYGFYPSNGDLRLTSFEGPDVFSWQVLRQWNSEHYQPGAWNRLKVRVEAQKLQCFVNEQLVLETTDVRPHGKRIGLAKFRDTKAQFKQFRVAPSLPVEIASAEELRRIEHATLALPGLNDITDVQLERLASNAEIAASLLSKRSDQLEEQALELTRVASQIQLRDVCGRLHDLAWLPAAGRDEAALTSTDRRTPRVENPDLDLLRASLQIARLDNADVDVDAYVARVDEWAAAIRASLPDNIDDTADTSAHWSTEMLAALNRFLFDESGFHGSRTAYYERANSHLDRVIDDREGLPITLAVLYIELGKRLGLQIEGVGLPGHFVVRFVPDSGDSQILDVFDRAKPLTSDEIAAIVRSATGVSMNEQHLLPTPPRAMLLRMLTNLLGVAERARDAEGMLRYVEAMVAIDDKDPATRGMRAVLRHQNGRRQAAIEDLTWIEHVQPVGVDLERIRQMRRAFEAQEKN